MSIRFARLQRLWPVAVLALGLAITWQVWLAESRFSERELHAEFETRVLDGSNRVQLRMDSYQQVLRIGISNGLWEPVGSPADAWAADGCRPGQLVTGICTVVSS